MRYVFNRAFLLLAGVLLGGCMQLETRISDHIAGQQNIAKICANPMLAQVSIKDRYQGDLADLVAFEFGLDLSGLNSEHGAILQALADIHDQMNAVYAEASPASKAAIDHITTEIRVIQESGAGIRDSVRSATKEVITQHPIGANNAYSDFEQILVKVAPQVRTKFAAMATSSSRLSVTLHSAIPTLTADPALAKVHSDRLSRDLTSLERAIKQALRKFDSLITRKKMFLASNENKQEVEDKLRVLMDDLITYEAARLLTLEISRAARSIEYKLDQVDEKTWFVVSLAGYAINDKTEKEMAKLLQETFLGKNAAIDTDLKQAFVIAACGQITADTSTAPTNTVRAGALLEPFYDAIIVGLGDDAPGPVAVSVSSPSVVTSVTTTKITHPSTPPPKAGTLTPQQVDDIVAGVVKKVKNTNGALRDYREARVKTLL